jgi:hypothetical protein
MRTGRRPVEYQAEEGQIREKAKGKGGTPLSEIMGRETKARDAETNGQTKEAKLGKRLRDPGRMVGVHIHFSE